MNELKLATTRQRNEIKALRKALHFSGAEFLEWMEINFSVRWTPLKTDDADRIIATLKQKVEYNAKRNAEKEAERIHV